MFSNQGGRPFVPTANEPFIRGESATMVIPSFAFNEEHEVTSRRLEDFGTLENPIVRISTAVNTANGYCANPAPPVASLECTQPIYHFKLSL